MIETSPRLVLVPGDDVAQEGILVGDEGRLEGGLRLGVVGEWDDHCLR